jgi:hypothetical protein
MAGITAARTTPAAPMMATMTIVFTSKPLTLTNIAGGSHPLHGARL